MIGNYGWIRERFMRFDIWQRIQKHTISTRKHIDKSGEVGAAEYSLSVRNQSGSIV